MPGGTSGSVDAYASSATDIVIDINGYYVPDGYVPTGTLNTAVGGGLYSNTTGTQNTAVGQGALPATGQMTEDSDLDLLVWSRSPRIPGIAASGFAGRWATCAIQSTSS